MSETQKPYRVGNVLHVSFARSFTLDFDPPPVYKSDIMHTPAKIISGGQTGVDRAGLDAAVRIGVETGGWCPAGRRAVDGVIPEKYDTLTETKARGYSVRTEWNVRDSGATLIINSGVLEGGTELTVKYAEGQGKPYLVVQLEDADAEQKLKDWLVKVRPAVLNVAGPREEKAPGIQKSACELLLRVFRGESDA